MTIEKEIRKARDTKGILVPLVMQFMTDSPVQIDSQEDVKFLTALLNKMMIREVLRQDPEDGPELRYYSPSSLGERCLRKAYLGRHAVRNPDAPSPYGLTSHYYFLTGNFIHIKWQFALYKMEKYIANSSIFRRYDEEIPVTSKHGDHRGTLDQIVFIRDEPYVLDYKGLNYFTARQVALGKISRQYKTQVADYLILWNSQRPCPFRIEKALLVVEDKGGGENFLLEHLITLERDGERARRRLAKLRAHEARNEMPPPLCSSLKDKGFQGCQFRTICWGEVEAAHKDRSRRTREALAKPEIPASHRVAKALKKGRR